ncbi:hypothetical protein MLD38_009386 [Melastoma candidum]|uniref:Uncharacterized protein n=1 Tax=Melastoma candidum TaxID=119954 RepID=A0ACB9RXC6_9MYRT|nr:hypothetical protein MLD38_009386 [Melastoma candidum]
MVVYQLQHELLAHVVTVNREVEADCLPHESDTGTSHFRHDISTPVQTAIVDVGMLTGRRQPRSLADEGESFPCQYITRLVKDRGVRDCLQAKHVLKLLTIDSSEDGIASHGTWIKNWGQKVSSQLRFP